MSFHFDKSVDIFFGEAKERLGDDYVAAMERAGISNDTTAFSKLPASKLNSLCNELFITFESIATGNVDILTVQNHLKGGSVLPAKYLRDVPFSSRFTSIYMLNYLRSVLGIDQVKFICQKFQLKDDQFNCTAARNNLLLPHDICAYVDHFFGESYVRDMGASSVDLLKKSEAFDTLAGERSITQFFERFIFEVLPEYVERNYNWSIDRAGHGFIQISGKPHGEVVANLSFNSHGTKALEILRQGFIQALLNLIGIRDANVERIASISRGDSCDTYFVHYGRRETERPSVH